ncbi:MAG: hypothetical protein JXR77_15490, partial [Lentisphaeria bacterium]|nr:hypothetical protein [Lentisphaeria bacterium]
MPLARDTTAAGVRRLSIHLVLMAGGLFFVLPLLWMIATSLKPLDQTMRQPDSLRHAFIGEGYKALLGEAWLPVTRERLLTPGPGRDFAIVRPREPFPAGELSHPFGKEVWDRYPVFNRQELARMNTPVTEAMNVLADERNPFDPAAGILTLQSGRRVAAELVRHILPDPSGSTLWLVREWRPEDTDTREVGSTGGDVTRRWDVIPERDLRLVPRFIPRNYPAA